MISYYVNSCNGTITLGSLGISWGNADAEYDLPGFCSLFWGDTGLEFGDIDQGRVGIYLTRYEDGEVALSRPLIQF